MSVNNTYNPFGVGASMISNTQDIETEDLGITPLYLLASTSEGRTSLKSILSINPSEGHTSLSTNPEKIEDIKVKALYIERSLRVANQDSNI